MGSKQNPLASIEEGRIGSWRNMNKTRGLQNIYVSTRNIYTVEKIKNQSDATIHLNIEVKKRWQLKNRKKLDNNQKLITFIVLI